MILGGAGNDTIQWSTGAGNDRFVSGSADVGSANAGPDDSDTFLLTASSQADAIEISAVATTVLTTLTDPVTGTVFTPQQDALGVRVVMSGGAVVSMAASSMENLVINAGDGADSILLNDLKGSSVTSFNLDLGTASGSSKDQDRPVGVGGCLLLLGV